jgi:lipopolysaccharide export LptBFGC system permease protein LptF
MLSSATSKDDFVEMATQILEEKSAKFKSECADAKLWELSKQLHCHRRAGRMFRSAELLSKTQESIRSERQEHIERALNNIASAFGTDGQHLLEYKDKLKGDFLNIAKDPTGKFKQMISTVSKLLSGSKRDKDQARRSIRKMPSTNVTEVTEEDSKEIEQVMKKLTREYDLQKPEVVSEAWSELDNLTLSQTHEEEGNSLLQVESTASSQYVYVSSGLILVIVLILIILLVIPGIHHGAVVSALITVLVVVLVLILIMMLVRFLLGMFRGGNRRSNNHRRRNSRRHRRN